MNLTGIPILDGFIQLAGNIFLAWLFIVAMGKITVMFQKHQYAQLVGTIIFFIIAFLFVNAPNVVMNLAKQLIGLASNI